MLNRALLIRIASPVRSVNIEFGANDDLNLLVEGAGAAESELIDVPVNADDGLLGKHLLIK